MKIVYVNKKHQCRMVTLDEVENRLWVKPTIRERLIEKRRVGFDLDQLESIKEMPAIAEKVSSDLSVVYLLMGFKDKRQVAIGVDEKGLYAFTAAALFIWSQSKCRYPKSGLGSCGSEIGRQTMA